MSEHYFTFPLAILWGDKPHHKTKNPPPITPLDCLELALNCGIVNAGKGYRKNYTKEDFLTRLDEVCEEKEVLRDHIPWDEAEALVGSAICGVRLGSTDWSNLTRIASNAKRVIEGGPFVRMKSSYFWAALSQARADADPSLPRPERGLSWREFRVLCAILSAKTNRANFAFIGWEVIQARAHGFTTKEQFKNAEVIPDHLAPPMTHKIIRPILETLENLGFYARFRFSTGKKGGYMAYSVRHTKEELGDAVCDFVNFKDRAGIKANREADAKKCLELLERAKVGQRLGKGWTNSRAKVWAKGGAKVWANIMRNTLIEMPS